MRHAPAQLLHFYRTMLLIRHFEETVEALFSRALVRGTTHPCTGQEATAVGACAALRKGDYVTSNHRGHGHFLACGGDPERMMAELFGKSTGYSGGRGGSQLMADYRIGFLGGNGITGGSIPVATGVALAMKMNAQARGAAPRTPAGAVPAPAPGNVPCVETPRRRLHAGGHQGLCPRPPSPAEDLSPSALNMAVVLCFFGDGASNQGTFHEALNMAGLWKLPIVYVCENNGYAMSTAVRDGVAVTDIAARAAGYGMPGTVVDGNDVLAMREATAVAVQRARTGEGPTLLECKTYRLSGHSRGDPRRYRTRDEEAAARRNDPIRRFHKYLLTESVLDTTAAAALRRDVRKAVRAAIHFAQHSPDPTPATLHDGLWAGGNACVDA